MAVLTAPRSRAVPQPAHLRPKQEERRHVHGDTVILRVTTNHRAQPIAQLPEWARPGADGEDTVQTGLTPLAGLPLRLLIFLEEDK
jgi:hypothetical protein